MRFLIRYTQLTSLAASVRQDRVRETYRGQRAARTRPRDTRDARPVDSIAYRRYRRATIRTKPPPQKLRTELKTSSERRYHLTRPEHERRTREMVPSDPAAVLYRHLRAAIETPRPVDSIAYRRYPPEGNRQRGPRTSPERRVFVGTVFRPPYALRRLGTTSCGLGMDA